MRVRHPSYKVAKWFFASLCVVGILSAQTIAEKKAGLVRSGADFDAETQGLLREVNHELRDKYDRLKQVYAKAYLLYESGASDAEYQAVLDQIQNLRAEILQTELQWRNAVTNPEKGEQYALWQQASSNVEELVIDYGSQDYVYIIPPEVGSIKLSLASRVPIPRALWGEMLEIILEQHGVGMRQLNPYLRQLFLIKDTQSGIRVVTRDRDDLEFLPRDARVGFVISPAPAQARRVAMFLEKFVNPSSTTFQMIGRDILVVGPVSEIQELIKLYDFVSDSHGDLEYKLVPLTKVDTKEMSDILNAMFKQFAKEEQVTTTQAPGGQTQTVFKSQSNEAGGLLVIPLTQVAKAVFLIGTREEIAKAQAIIMEVESRVGTARGKVVFTYRTKHSDPEEMAQVLVKIYTLLSTERLEQPQDFRGQRQQMTQGGQQGRPGAAPSSNSVQTQANPQDVNVTVDQTQPAPNVPPYPWMRSILQAPFPTTVDDSPSFYQSGAVVVNPAPILMSIPVAKEVNKGRENFIVDPKTGIIVMVVEPDLLPRMKELIRRIDVPKKMVQLDVLLFEKQNTHETNYGLNLFRMGSAASNTKKTSLIWNDVDGGNPCAATKCPANEGIFEFILSRMRGHGMPAYDLAYKFLMSQQDISINANPTVVTLNQTPASISIVTEQSISTGVVEVQAAGGIQAKDAFTRAQYGTNIVITPTIHAHDEEDKDWWDDSPDYITLDTQVNFDTVTPDINSRPNVIRRNIKNIVRVPDGKTVILGGLRSKDCEDDVDRVPFLGEIPGVGKLFSETFLGDKSTEMFIFITPTIVSDPCEDFEKIKREQLARRPGDIPEFLCALAKARRCEQHMLFEQGMNMLFGRRCYRCIPWGDDSCGRMPSFRRGYQIPGPEDCYDQPYCR